MFLFSVQVSADKLDSITAFPKFFSQASYTKLASYRRAIFQALEVILAAGQSYPACGSLQLIKFDKVLGVFQGGSRSSSCQLKAELSFQAN